MRHCWLCRKKVEKGNGTFFNVPRDEHMREKWSEICEMKFTPNARICIDHFSAADIIPAGRRPMLLPSAMPIVEVYHNIKTENSINISAFDESEQVPPKLQEESQMKISSVKSATCTESTQTNTFICGLVQVSGNPYEFHFNCFYCSKVYQLRKWKNFVNHLQLKHSDIEQAFKMFNYASDDHDYTPSSLSTPDPVEDTSENVVKSKSPSLDDPLESMYNTSGSVVIEPTFCYTSNENKMDTNNFIDTYTSEIATAASEITNELDCSTEDSDKNTTQKTLQKKKSNAKQPQTALNRCLRRTNSTELIEPEENYSCTFTSIEIIQQNSTEITFEYTPPDIVDLLLDSMKNYDVLWRFDNQPFNEDFIKAVEDLCKIINEKCSLNIDDLKMRRSINRILRFYCYLYPNANVENIHQFTNYYDKCATFLPSVGEIAYARCSQCYVCYEHDFDLKRHLLGEQKCLQRPFKCVQCKECFKEYDEYQFHKLLPHYDEVFRCEPCGKTFLHRNVYNKHIVQSHPQKPVKYKCDMCDKVYQSKASLRNHKFVHGDKNYKCHLCPKSFFANTYLSRHLKIHQKQYDFMCEVCGNEYITQGSLSRHMAKHTGAKVTCHICNLKLRKSSLRQHIRVFHEQISEKKVSRIKTSYRRLIKRRPQRPYKRKDEERKYHCKICKISFETFKLILEHNKEFHFDIPKLPCKMCNRKFSQKMSLKRHYRRKHNLHVIQVFKLVNENEDINVVLNMKSELLDELTQIIVASNDKVKAGASKSQPNSVLSNEMLFEIENNYDSIVEDEMIEASDNETTQEIKIDYMNDIFTDLLKEEPKDT